MKIDIHVHMHGNESEFLAHLVQMSRQIQSLKEIIMTSDATNAAKIDAVNTQLVKATGEIVAQVQALKDALANQDTTPETDAALAKLVATAQALDDLNPDAPAPAPVEPTV